MELSFSQLRAKEVINTQDGRRLGKVCDIALCYPENRWIGIVVPGGRGFFRKNDLFIELKNIVKIGEDVILVNVGFPRGQNCAPRRPGMPFSPSPSPHTKNTVDYHAGFSGDMRENRNYEEYE